MQQSDFEGIFEAMAGLPVSIRLLDPPLHEFLPSLDEATSDAMRDRIRQLHEANPMLGTRGCRLGLQFPEIYEMQVRAIVRAARAVHERTGEAPLVEIVTRSSASRRSSPGCASSPSAWRPRNRLVEYLCGTMIELPRAALPCGRDRGRGRLLLVRDERPHADDAGLLAGRRRGEVPRRTTSSMGSSSGTRSR